MFILISLLNIGSFEIILIKKNKLLKENKNTSKFYSKKNLKKNKTHICCI